MNQDLLGSPPQFQARSIERVGQAQDQHMYLGHTDLMPETNGYTPSMDQIPFQISNEFVNSQVATIGTGAADVEDPTEQLYNDSPQSMDGAG